MFDFQRCTKLRLLWILSLHDLLQSLNLEITPIDYVEPHFPHDNVGGSHSWNECRKLIVPAHAGVHFVTDRANLLTDHRVSGRPVRARYKHFKTTWEQTSENSPLFSSFSFLVWWSSNQGLKTLKSCSTFLFANSQYRSTHFRACPSESYRRTTLKFSREVCPILVILRYIQQK